MAAVNEAGTPAASITTRAPSRRCARARPRRRRWRSGSRTRSAPSACTAARRSAAGSTTVTSSTPSARRARQRADPDGTATEHDRRVARARLAAQHRAVRDRHRLDQRAVHRAETLGELVRHVLAHDGELGEATAGPTEAVAQHLEAQVGVAVGAGRARAARPQRLDRDEVADGHRGDALAQLDDLARELVADRRSATVPGSSGRRRTGAGRCRTTRCAATRTFTVPGVGSGSGDVLEADVTGSVVQRGTHRSCPPGSAISGRSPGHRRRRCSSR